MSNIKIEKKYKYVYAPANNVLWAAHKINDVFVMPLDVLIEIISSSVIKALGVTQDALNNIEFSDISIINAITSNVNQSCDITVSLTLHGHTGNCFIIATSNDISKPILQSNISVDGKRDDSTVFKNQNFLESIAKNQIYRKNSRHYIGREYQNLESISLSRNDCYAALRLSNDTIKLHNRCITNPFVLNGLVHAAIILLDHDYYLKPAPPLPIKIGSIIFQIEKHTSQSAKNYKIYIEKYKDNSTINAVCVNSHGETILEVESMAFNGGYLTQKSKLERTQNISDNLATYINKEEDIAIIGLAGYFPESTDIHQLWDNLLNENNCTSSITSRWSSDLFSEIDSILCQNAGLLDNIDIFDNHFFNISPLEANYIDPQQRLFLQTAWLALNDAGYTSNHNLNKINRNCGVFVGATQGDYLNITDHANMPPQGFWGNAPSLIASRISYYLDLNGPAITYDTACSSSLLAIHEACNVLRNDECSLAIAGGVFIMTTPQFIVNASRANMLSKTGICGAFSQDANGFVPGEASSAIILKRLSHALKDGDNIYAVIKGSACNQDGKSNGITAPNKMAQKKLITKLYKSIDINPSDISYIETHGTGTELGDPIEINALMEAFQDFGVTSEQSCGIGSIKTNIGHTSLASGCSGIVKLILSLYYKKLPASLNCETENKLINFHSSPFYVVKHTKDWVLPEHIPLRITCISSFGFSGTNVHMCLTEYRTETNKEVLNEDLYFFVFSAHTLNSLKNWLGKLTLWIELNEPSLYDLSYTLSCKRNHFKYRLVILAEDKKQLLSKINQYLNEPNKDISLQLKDYPEKFKPYIHDYVQGNDTDFSPLFSAYIPLPIGLLPRYEFDNHRYWAGNDKSTINQHKTHEQHQYTFDKSQSYIKNHIVNGEHIVPGVASALILCGFDSNNINNPNKAKLSVSDFYWHRPIVVKNNKTAIDIKIDDQQRSLISSINGELFCQCRIEHSHDELSKSKNLNRDIMNELKSPNFPHDLYQWYTDIGLEFGPRMKLIKSYYIDKNIVYGSVSLDANDKNDDDLSKTIRMVDSAIQLIGLLLKDDNCGALYVPYYVEKIHYLKPVSNSIYVKIEMINDPTLYKFNISIYNESFELALNFENFTPKMIPKNVIQNEQINYTKPIWIESTLPEIYHHHARKIIIICHANKRNSQSLCIYVKKIFTNAAIFPVMVTDHGLVVNNRNYINNESMSAWLKLFADTKDTDLIINFLPYQEDEQSAILQTFDMIISALNNENRIPAIYTIFKVTNSNLYGSSLSGLMYCLSHEERMTSFKLIGISADINENEILECLYREYSLSNNETEVIYENIHKRLTRSFVPLNVNIANNKPKLSTNNGCYVIIGGMGYIGRLIAESLLQKTNSIILLFGRRKLIEQEYQWVNNHSNLIYCQADINNYSQLDICFKKYVPNDKRIDTIFFAPMVLSDKLCKNLEHKNIIEVLNPKISGLLNLEILIKDFTVNNIILFSSLVSLYGNPGQSAYAVANAFMNRYAQAHHLENITKGSTKIVAVNLPPVSSELSEDQVQRARKYLKSDAISNSDLLKIIDIIDNIDCPNIVIRKYFPDEQPISNDKSSAKDNNTCYNIEDSRNIIVNIFSQVLQIEPRDIISEKPINDYGIDSLMMLNIIEKLEVTFGKLSKTLLLEHPNITSLAKYLANINIDFIHLEKISDETPAISKTVSRDETDIAIIGISINLPKANTLSEYWDILKNGKNCITQDITKRFPNVDYQYAATLDDPFAFDPLFFKISPSDALIMDPHERLMLQSAWHAFEDAGLIETQLSKSKIGVFVGAMNNHYQISGLQASISQHKNIIANSTAGSIANRISYYFDLSGPSLTLDTMCSSSLTALHYACMSLHVGESDAAIVGGVNLLTNPYKYLELKNRNMLSPTGQCHAFGKNADGYVPSEGCIALVIKRLDDAQKDNDSIYGIIKSTAIGHDAKTNGYTVPNAVAQSNVITDALNRAKITPDKLRYIEAHGTGTLLGDPIEVNALNAVFDSYNVKGIECPIGSVKSNFGHLEAASGLAGLVKIILQMQHKTLVPSINSEILNPNIDFSDKNLIVQSNLSQYEETANLTHHQSYFGLSSFGAGGSNAHVILQSHNEHYSIENDKKPYIICLSARDHKTLQIIKQQLSNWINNSEIPWSIGDLSYTLNECRQHMNIRSAIVVNGKNELLRYLKEGDKTPAVPFSAVDDLDILYEQFKTADNKHNILACIAEHYISGININWNVLYSDRAYHKILSLPGYPFAERHFNVYEKINAQYQIEDETLKAHNPINLITTRWKNKEFKEAALTQKKNTKYLYLIRESHYNNKSSIDKWFSDKDNSFILTIDHENNLRAASDKRTKKQVCCASVELNTFDVFVDLLDLEPTNSWETFYARLDLWQKFVSVNRDKGSRIIHFYDDKFCSIKPNHSAMFGCLASILQREYLNINAVSIGVDDHEINLQAIVQVVSSFDTHETHLKYTQGSWYCQEQTHCSEVNEQNLSEIDCDKTYMITGATGNIGREIIRWLVKSGVRKLILFTQQQQSLDRPEVSVLFHELNQYDCQYVIYTGQLNDMDKLSDFFEKNANYLDNIGSIFYCAGWSPNRPSAFTEKNHADFKKAFIPKISGLEIFYQHIKNIRFDKMILFSSIAQVLPKLGVGITEYAVANAYMSDFAKRMKNLGEDRVISINWPSWFDFDKGASENQSYKASNVGTLSVKQALGVIKFALTKAKVPNEFTPTLNMINIVDKKLDNNNAENSHYSNQDNINQKPDKVQNDIINVLISIFQTTLKLEKCDLSNDITFNDLGIDSVYLLQIMEEIEKTLDVKLSPDILINYNSLSKLSHYLKNISTPNNIKNEHKYKPLTINLKKTEQETIAVIGMDCEFPNANNVTEFWHNLQNGKNCVTTMPSYRITNNAKNHALCAGIISDIRYFDYQYFHFSKDEAIQLDPIIRKSLEVAVKAVHNAGYHLDELKDTNTGVFLGARASNYASFLPITKHTILANGQNFIATHISHFLNIHGPALVIDTACSSSMVSVHMAAQSILNNECDIALAGGVDILLNERPFDLLKATSALSTGSICKPFDVNADGVILGEGAGIIVLKKLSKAIADKDRIIATIAASSINNNGQTMGYTTPNPAAQTEVIASSLRKSNLEITNIDYFEMHATGTQVGDPMELKSISTLFDKTEYQRQKYMIGSVKANIGHTLCASGIASIIKSLLCLEYKIFVKQINCETLNSRYNFNNSPFSILHNNMNYTDENKYISVNSFGFGGTNANIILKSYNASNGVKNTRNKIETKFNRTYCWYEKNTDEHEFDFSNFFNIREKVSDKHV